MHARDIKKSQRLRDILAMLTRRGSKGATSAELAALHNSMSIGTDVSEVRQNLERLGLGMQILCCCDQRKPVAIYRYTLVYGMQEAA